MKIAVIQFKANKGPTPRHRAQARETLGSLIAAAGERGARLIVCPEMATSGYLFENSRAAAQVAEPVHGEGLTHLGELAARYGTFIVCGYLEMDPPAGTSGPRSLLYNSARIIGPAGQLLYNYRKRLLYDSDHAWALPGNTPYPLLELPFGRLSAGICMDLNDDRFTAFLRTAEPRLIAFCTNWLDQGVDIVPYWRHRLRGTWGYFLAANTYGSEEAPGHPPTRFLGNSAILGPGGQVLAQGPSEGDAVVLADIPEPDA